ncbi:hypothetical protein L226DRAFT_146641 [Lentinus tigrinus ALCF2SS1-7]|uniref:uncharacterized protein n=1 Tax=Lentinus tigrinus ALCF2SS1-7 TaxID=1328758 RepID=UPI0011662E0A|nr:hypothetical protein L226DRAFT_146641 [Lentinus tigrinus ALCF2SS1-7]
MRVTWQTVRELHETICHWKCLRTLLRNAQDYKNAERAMGYVEGMTQQRGGSSQTRRQNVHMIYYQSLLSGGWQVLADSEQKTLSSWNADVLAARALRSNLRVLHTTGAILSAGQPSGSRRRQALFMRTTVDPEIVPRNVRNNAYQGQSIRFTEVHTQSTPSPHLSRSFDREGPLQDLKSHNQGADCEHRAAELPVHRISFRSTRSRPPGSYDGTRPKTTQPHSKERRGCAK